jgi:hypothetical protein
MSALIVIPPIAVTDAVLTSSTVAETDYAAWSAATNYTIGTRVIRTTTHTIYENVLAGIDATVPESAPTRWLAVSPTNRWKMFDTSNTSTTIAASPVSIVLLPGEAVNAVALLGLVATSVRIRMTDPIAGTVYDKTYAVGSGIIIAEWYDYFFGRTRAVPQLIVTDLPAYPAGSVLIDITNTAASVQCATCVLGMQTEIGLGVLYGAVVGIQDYSVTTRNDFGDTTLVKRAYAKRATFNIPLLASEVDSVLALLAENRAVPCVWVGSASYTSAVIFGFYKDFSITVQYPTMSLCALEIEGMT